MLEKLLGMAYRNEIRGIAVAALIKDETGQLDALCVVSNEADAHALQMTGALANLKDDWMRMSEPEHFVPPEPA